MPLSAALPGVAVALRVTRTAAGRRVLQVGLLVGGLFVLGLLCGEQARAADGVAPTSALTPTGGVRSVDGSAERLVSSSVGQVAKSSESGSGPGSEQQTEERSAQPKSSSASLSGYPSSASPSGYSPSSVSPSGSSPADASSGPVELPKAIAPVTDRVQGVVRPVTEQVVHPVTDRVVRPITGRVVPPVADDVVRPIGDLVDQITGGLTEPSVPPESWPSLPQLPTLPGLPGLPELPGLPATPGQTLPVGTAPQQPGGAAEEHWPAGREVEKTARDEGGAGAYGPRSGDGPAVAGGDVRHDDATDADATRGAQAAAQQAPDDEPTGALGHRSAVDNGSPRHGDAQAVALHERAQPWLVPGAAADVTAAVTRDRHRDIPAFPG